ncbi:unnamed protein product [Malus baccata var. baccata]
MVGDLDYLFLHLAFYCFLSEHFVSQVVLSLVSVFPEFISNIFSLPCSFPNIDPYRESSTIYPCYSFHWVSSPKISSGGTLWWFIAFKVHFALFGRIMEALLARVACLPLFFVHPFGYLVLLMGGGDRSAMVVFFGSVAAMGCLLWALLIVVFVHGVGFVLGHFGLSFGGVLTLY